MPMKNVFMIFKLKACPVNECKFFTGARAVGSGFITAAPSQNGTTTKGIETYSTLLVNNFM